MPTTTNDEYQQSRPIPEGITPNTEVFYINLTNEVFKDYDEFFERTFQLNNSCWTCTITGRNGLTYEEALQSENEAIEQINNFPAFLETPILYLIHRFTCRARVEELVGDVMAFMRDRYFMDEEVVFKDGRNRYPARITGITYRPSPPARQGNGSSSKPMQNGTTSSTDNKKQSTTKSSPKSPGKSTSKADAGMELCPADSFTYSLQILQDETDSDEESSDDDNDHEGGGAKRKTKETPSQVADIPHFKIGRGKGNHATRPRIKLFIRYYTELSADGRLVVKRSSIDDFMLNQLSWEQQIFTESPAPKFPETRKKIKSAVERTFSSMEDRRQAKHQQQHQLSHGSNGSDFMQPSTSRQQQKQQPSNEQKPRSSAAAGKAATAAAAKKEETRRKEIYKQQAQLEPLFEKADRFEVDNVQRWRQQWLLLTEEDVQELRDAIVEAKEARRREQVERRKREREAIVEWRKPRDDLLCDDLRPFPAFSELTWPDWIPRDLYWEVLSIQSFFHSFAEVLFANQQNPFTLTNIATALVSRQVSENCQLYQLLDWLMTAVRTCLEEDDGDPADLSRPEHIGNELAKDIDHPVHGARIRRINLACERQKKIHGVHIRGFHLDFQNVTEVIRLHLKTSGYYTQYRRQLRSMHCYEDAGYLFARNEPEIMDRLKKSSVFALSPQQRVKLINVLINQLLSFRRCRNLLDERFELLSELKRELRHLRTVDLQHEREAREAQHALAQQNGQNINQAQAADGMDKAKAQSLKELANLRRALIQLNEGRRVQNIAEIRDRLTDEEVSLPWELMASVCEVQEFRAVQRNFHGDKTLEMVRRIYELQGKMGMFFLGRDRAFRAYYYMCSAFVIVCPPEEELGRCGGEPTPKQQKTANNKNNEEEMDAEEEEQKMMVDDVMGMNDGQLNAKTEVKTENKNGGGGGGEEAKLEEEGAVVDQQQDDDDDIVVLLEAKKKKPVVDRLMACTGSAATCPVHNPPDEWPRLLYYTGRDAVKKLLDALNPRGFRETELAENIALFKEVYIREMNTAADILEERKAASSTQQQQLSQSAQLFGFAASLPKELAKDGAAIAAAAEKDEKDGTEAVDAALLAELRKELLEVEEIITDKRLGTLQCTVSREEWRKALEEGGDTSQFCVDHRIPILHSPDPEELLYTPEDLGQPERLSTANKLAIALIQMAQGVRPECMHSPLMCDQKRNGTIKHLPTQTFIEWQRALKGCRSPSAVSLFETTFEYSVNWDHNRSLTSSTASGSLTSTSKFGSGRRRPTKDGSSHEQQQQQQQSNKPLPRAFREAELLLATANQSGLIVSGTRNRKPVTKYGECEMDLDKLDLDGEEARNRTSTSDDEEEEGGWSSKEEEEERTEDDEEEDNDDDEGNDDNEGDEDMEVERGVKPKGHRTHHNSSIEHFDGFGAVRYEGLGLRKRKTVTHFDPTSYHAGGTSKRDKTAGDNTYYDDDDNDEDGGGNNAADIIAADFEVSSSSSDEGEADPKDVAVAVEAGTSNNNNSNAEAIEVARQSDGAGGGGGGHKQQQQQPVELEEWQSLG